MRHWMMRDDTAERKEALANERTAERETRVPVIEERITVEKQVRDIGEVLFQRKVSEVAQTVAVEVSREALRVTRRDVPARAAVPAELERAFAAGLVRVPVFGESAHAGKRAFVTGEVLVRRRPVVEQRTITETVRRERVETEVIKRREPVAQVDYAQRAERRDRAAAAPPPLSVTPAVGEDTADALERPETPETPEARELRLKSVWRDMREGFSRGRSRAA